MIPKFFISRADGGSESGVRGFWLIEWKSLFSIVLLRFSPGSRREVYHSHAFAAVTWWLRGDATEEHADGRAMRWRPSLLPKWTPRSTCHRIRPARTTWALSLRGPWRRTWLEHDARRRKVTHLTSGRRVVREEAVR